MAHDRAARARGRVHPVADAGAGADELLRAARRPAQHETWLLRKAHAALRAAAAPRAARPSRRRSASACSCCSPAAVALFTRLGAEFVPQLDEGDLLVEARRLPGHRADASRSPTDLRIAAGARRRSPRSSTSSRETGAPELATDPMGIEQTDVYIDAQGPREQWRAGLTKEELAEGDRRGASRRAVPEVAGGTLAADPDAHQRARRGRALGRRRA